MTKIPVVEVEYDQAKRTLAMLPAEPTEGRLWLVRLDDGASFAAERRGDGFYEAKVGGWSRYCLASN